MNPINETIVSNNMLDEMRKAGVADDYAAVPKALERRARKLLGNKKIVTYSNDSKLKKQIMRLKNRLNESKRREAAQSPIVVAQLASIEELENIRAPWAPFGWDPIQPLE